MSQQRVMITGMGALTACGHSLDATWDALLMGQSGIAEIKQWDVSSWPCHLAGELKDFQAPKMLPDRKLMKAISRQDVLGINAAMQAIESSHLLSHRDSLNHVDVFNEQTGVYVASPGNKYLQQYDFLPLLAKAGDDMQVYAERLFDEVHPMWLLRILPNNVLAYTGITYGFKGPNHNFSNHVVGGAQAVLEAYHAISSGQAERAVVVGYDVGHEPQALFYYDKLGVLSYKGLKPFDVAHDGTILAEGAAALVLESEASAKVRNAHCYAEIVGGKTAAEGAGLFGVESEGATLSALMTDTLESLSLSTEDMACVLAHGNGNPQSDDSEAKALAQVFGEKSVAVTAFKWAMGHTLCAASILDIALMAKCFESKTLPGIATLEACASSAAQLDLVDKTRPLADKPYALLVSRGFASLNACIVMKSCDEA